MKPQTIDDIKSIPNLLLDTKVVYQQMNDLHAAAYKLAKQFANEAADAVVPDAKNDFLAAMKDADPEGHYEKAVVPMLGEIVLHAAFVEVCHAMTKIAAASATLVCEAEEVYKNETCRQMVPPIIAGLSMRLVALNFTKTMNDEQAAKELEANALMVRDFIVSNVGTKKRTVH